MITEDVIAGGQAGEHVGLSEFSGDGNIVGAKRGRHNRCSSGNDCSCAQQAHTSLAKHRVQRCHKDDSQVGSTRNDQRQQVAQQESNRHEDIRGLDVRNRLGEHTYRDFIGSDMGHVAGVATKDEDDEASRSERAHELIAYNLERIKPSDTTGNEVGE